MNQKQIVKETLEPVPLFKPGSSDPIYWVCAHCNQLYSSGLKEAAKGCCLQKYCPECKCEMDYYRTLCTSCGDAKRMAAAQEVTDYNGELYDDSSDRYFSDIDEAIEHFDDEEDDDSRPEFLYCCKEMCAKDSLKFRMSDWVTDFIADNFHEDAADDLIELKELNAFCTEWANKQTIVSYLPDYKRKVRLPKREVAES